MPEHGAVLVERLHVRALSECVALALDREWAADSHKWQLIFECGEVWGIRDADGELVGTATATRFGNTVVIGMVLVARHAERQGLGQALMRHVMQRHSDAVHILNATSYGQPLYEKLGFTAIGTTYSHRGIFRPDAGADASLPQTRPAALAELPALTQLDAQIVGAERAPLMRALLTNFARTAVAIDSAGGELAAFGACWSNQDNEQVGPLFGENDGQIEALIASLAAGVNGTFRVDLNDRDSAVREWATAHGLLETSSSTLMVHGASALPGDRRRWYSALMQAIG